MLNGDQPVTSSPYQAEGVLRADEPDQEQAARASRRPSWPPPPDGAGQLHLLQAAGLLWTARRAAGRAVNRLPMDPTWDTTGLRMELVR